MKLVGKSAAEQIHDALVPSKPGSQRILDVGPRHPLRPAFEVLRHSGRSPTIEQMVLLTQDRAAKGEKAFVDAWALLQRAFRLKRMLTKPPKPKLAELEPRSAEPGDESPPAEPIEFRQLQVDDRFRSVQPGASSFGKLYTRVGLSHEPDGRFSNAFGDDGERVMFSEGWLVERV